jgi:Xaa-Pro dipeptidase
MSNDVGARPGADGVPLAEPASEANGEPVAEAVPVFERPPVLRLPSAWPTPEPEPVPVTPPPSKAEGPGSDTQVSISLDGMTDPRRVDVDAKQELVAKLLHDSACEGLLVLHPANFRWLTAGAQPAGLAGRDEMPALYFNSGQRWLVASATDTPRLFADEMDGLGFQLKEWHWSASREQLLADLVFGRKVVCDQAFRDCKPVGPFCALRRRQLTTYEADRLAELGEIVAQSVEATARQLGWGDTEDEIAGQLAHRLLRRGAEPVAFQVSGDGRARSLRRRGYKSEPVERSCVLQVTARKFGLHATASRTVFRAAPSESERAEFEAALRARVAHLARAKVGDRVSVTLDAGKAVLRPTPFEHEWRLAPPVCLTSREPSEGVFLATAQDKWVAGWAVVWQERVGAAALVDTYLVEPNGWRAATPPLEWPIRRAVTQGRSFDLADLLVRED